MERRRAIIAAGKKSLLPPQYQQVEWIKSDGSAYIKTNYIPGLNLSVRWKYELTYNYSGDKIMFGSTIGQSGKRSFYAEAYNIAATKGRWYCGCNLARYQNVLNEVGGVIGTIYDGYMDSETLTVDEKSAYPTGSSDDATLPELGIFCWMRNQTPEYIHGYMKLHYLEIKQSGALSANFIPCYRKSDSEIGMYDTVSGIFYSNSGTGTFTKGNDVN